MSVNKNVPLLITLTSSQTCTVENARGVSVFASGGTATIVNSQSQTMTIPDSTTIDINADNGNVLTNLTITCANTAYIVVLGGNATVV